MGKKKVMHEYQSLVFYVLFYEIHLFAHFIYVFMSCTELGVTAVLRFKGEKPRTQFITEPAQRHKQQGKTAGKRT